MISLQFLMLFSFTLASVAIEAAEFGVTEREPRPKIKRELKNHNLKPKRIEIVSSDKRKKTTRRISPLKGSQYVGSIKVEKSIQRIQSFPGGEAVVTERLGNKGMILERTLNFGDRTEVAIDSNADGHIDEWLLFSKSFNMKLSDPHDGIFTFMEIDKFRNREIIKLKLVLNKLGNYELIGRQRLAWGSTFALHSIEEDFVVGECRETESFNYRQVDQWVEEKKRDAASGVNNDDAFRKIIVNKILDNSCKNEEFAHPQGSGKSNLKDDDEKLINSPMVNGILSVFNSSIKESPSGQFLSCLKKYELNAHATRIERHLQALTFEDSNLSWEIKCETFSSANRNSDRCSPRDSKTTRRGQAYREDINSGATVKFIKDCCEYNSGRCMSSAEDYANTFFHEMLHVSGIPHDDKSGSEDARFKAITGCCGGGELTSSQNDRAKSCNSLKTLVTKQKEVQKVQRVLIETIEPASYRAAMSACEKIYPEGCEGKMQRWLDQLATKADKVITENENCPKDIRTRDYKSVLANPSTSPDQAALIEKMGKCKVALFDSIKATTDEVFNDMRCRGELRSTDPSIGKEEVKAICTLFREDLKAMFSGEHPNNTIKLENLDTTGICKKKIQASERLFKVKIFADTFAFFKSLLKIESVFANSKIEAICQDLARVTDGVNWDKYYQTSSSPLERERDGHIASVMQREDTANEASRNPVKNTSREPDRRISKDHDFALSEKGTARPILTENVSSQRSQRVFGSEEIGPRLLKFSDTESTRAKQIAFDIRRQNDSENRINEYVERVYREVIPTASASRNTNSNNFRDENLVLANPLKREVSNLPDIKLASGNGKQDRTEEFNTFRGNSKNVRSNDGGDEGNSKSITKPLAFSKQSEKRGTSEEPAVAGGKLSTGMGGRAVASSGAGSLGAGAGKNSGAIKTQGRSAVDKTAQEALVQFLLSLKEFDLRTELENKKTIERATVNRINIIDWDRNSIGAKKNAERFLLFDLTKRRLSEMSKIDNEE